MLWTFTGHVDGLPDGVEHWLRTDPARNTVPLTVLGRMRAGLWADGATLGWLTADGEVCGAVVHTPPYPLLLADIPVDSVPALADAVRGREISAVSGPCPQAEVFAEVSGLTEVDRTRQRLYRLQALSPASSTGAPRPAGEADVEPVAAWMRAFIAEAEPGSSGSDPLPQMRHRIDQGEIVLWEDGGRPVAMAGFSRPISGMSRIGPVYTPPGLRGRGYGSAVTHAATRAAQEAGGEVILLFTDLSNPTSNSIYQALGYRPLSDYISISFSPGDQRA
ncbi:GNAT family N-acetyltransferase [Sphaerisporangium album]|uniref:GNAT family N-acetyltransferase n=1 Tax=Sphaerisporangium album TaxID=509200 RepID=A0A367F3Y3_9ACTN|nr:GNAT family N-acetyltransferase [Sphaerisporangium album]RCG25084.1 GNAT family N-acetyltransferase [Sphaerisporangium album]